jgi:hypothetical protein
LGRHCWTSGKENPKGVGIFKKKFGLSLGEENIGKTLGQCQGDDARGHLAMSWKTSEGCGKLQRTLDFFGQTTDIRRTPRDIGKPHPQKKKKKNQGSYERIRRELSHLTSFAEW